MLQEFKAFIMRGNVIDLAVGVIIGGAFGAITTSLVNDILMPLLGVLTGGINFKGLSFNVGDAVIQYGNFIQSIITFLILAFAIFWLVKMVNKLSNKKEETPATPPQEILLTEIRDILKEQNK